MVLPELALVGGAFRGLRRPEGLLAYKGVVAEDEAYPARADELLFHLPAHPESEVNAVGTLEVAELLQRNESSLRPRGIRASGHRSRDRAVVHAGTRLCGGLGAASKRRDDDDRNRGSHDQDAPAQQV